MGRFTQRNFADYQADTPDEKYNLAYRRVKKIKGFYIHVLVYVLVNTFIIISSFNRSLLGNEIFFRWETFSTALFWGIGLLAHGLSVFGSTVFLGQNWEEKKIKELMNKDKSDNWE
ncbi:2TM domain-containing protein [Flavobacterium restrictum]|uniref:2TM domain-containing protein n=1 Tax=Flavobacterium restrictum TaxID=2594428 RepID=A0A553E8G3_9FLAO|nr:2TM domain-containing protein [Flavobacterium restrictum]TRX41354.1 2TM domain-containing protein [Flavobacterium restrictum]